MPDQASENKTLPLNPDYAHNFQETGLCNLLGLRAEDDDSMLDQRQAISRVVADDQCDIWMCCIQ